MGNKNIVQTIQEVWLDQQNHVVTPVHDTDFYAAWGRGKIKRVLRPDPTTSSIQQVVDQFFQYYQDHALAHKILTCVITMPDAQTFECSYAYGQDHQGHEPINVGYGKVPIGPPRQLESLDPHIITGAAIYGTSSSLYSPLVNRMVEKILQPDDADVLQRLQRPSQTMAGNNLTSDQIGFSLVAHAITQVTRWCIEVPTLLMPASTITVLLRDDQINRLGFFQQGTATLMDKSVVCLGGPADPTWVEDTPAFVVVGKDLGWRAIAKPWTVDVGRSITASCRIATEITNPRACCVVTVP